MIKALKKCSSRKVIKKALKILLKKVNLLKKGLEKVQPVKKVNSSVSTQKSELKKSSKN